MTVGEPAPEFSLKDQSQKDVKLSDFRGHKRVVLMFYPLDWSPVCTNEHACFVNQMKQFEQLDAQVLGLSVDSVWSHKAYAEKMGIQYPLLADFHPRGAVAAQYGVYLADKGITGRAISIIDRDGKLAWHKNYDIPAVPRPPGSRRRAFRREVRVASRSLEREGATHSVANSPVIAARPWAQPTFPGADRVLAWRPRQRRSSPELAAPPSRSCRSRFPAATG
jgi:peroxiredoxin